MQRFKKLSAGVLLAICSQQSIAANVTVEIQRFNFSKKLTEQAAALAGL